MVELNKRPLAPRDLLIRVTDRAGLEESIRHPLNPNSELHGVALSRRTGLARLGANLLRVPPNKESYALHVHAVEEEWLYVLSGRGVAEIGDEAFEVAPGDFIGFPAGLHAHLMRNPHNEDLTYLSGGEILRVDVVDFPRAERRLVQVGRDLKLYPASQGKPLFHSSDK